MRTGAHNLAQRCGRTCIACCRRAGSADTAAPPPAAGAAEPVPAGGGSLAGISDTADSLSTGGCCCMAMRRAASRWRSSSAFFAWRSSWMRCCERKQQSSVSWHARGHEMPHKNAPPACAQAPQPAEPESFRSASQPAAPLRGAPAMPDRLERLAGIGSGADAAENNAPCSQRAWCGPAKAGCAAPQPAAPREPEQGPQQER